jgi:hypothetical protein
LHDIADVKFNRADQTILLRGGPSPCLLDHFRNKIQPSKLYPLSARELYGGISVGTAHVENPVPIGQTGGDLTDFHLDYTMVGP